MQRHSRWHKLAAILLPVLLVGIIDPVVQAQTPKKTKVQKSRPRPPQVQPKPAERARPRRERPQRTYVRPRRDYGHVRLTRRERHDGRIDVRPIIVRSTRVTPIVLQRFEDRRREQLQLVIRGFRQGDRAQSLAVWSDFVTGLAEYPEPVDLDDIMLYVARESCLNDDAAFLFHAARVEFLNASAEQWEDYVAQIEEQRDDCRYGRRACSAETHRNLEAELTRRRAEWEVFDIQAQAAGKEFDRVIQDSQGYEQRFATTFEDMYREVEVRIQYSP